MGRGRARAAPPAPRIPPWSDPNAHRGRVGRAVASSPPSVRGDAIMVGPFRRFAVVLAFGLLAPGARGAPAGAGQAPAPAGESGEARPAPADFALPGEEPPRPFV